MNSANPFQSGDVNARMIMISHTPILLIHYFEIFPNDSNQVLYGTEIYPDPDITSGSPTESILLH